MKIAIVALLTLSCCFGAKTQGSRLRRRLLGVTQSELAAANSSDNCWLQIDSDAYDVTAYAPGHPSPRGEDSIFAQCGNDVTAKFYAQVSHSAALLALVTNLGPVSAPAPRGVTSTELAAANSPEKCWLQIDSDAYDVTAYAPLHPSPLGEDSVFAQCGNEITTEFYAQPSHSAALLSMVTNLGPVTIEPTAPPFPDPTPSPTPTPPTPPPTPPPVPNPTGPPTSAPFPLPTALPVASPTTPPSPLPTALPVASPTTPPVPAPTAPPVPIPTAAPLSNPTPVASPTTPLVPAPTAPPVLIPTAAPLSNPTPMPAVVSAPPTLIAPTSTPIVYPAPLVPVVPDNQAPSSPPFGNWDPFTSGSASEDGYMGMNGGSHYNTGMGKKGKKGKKVGGMSRPRDSPGRTYYGWYFGP